MSAVGFTTNESSQVLLVSVHNIIYPITEYELHLVFDPFGYVEKIDILQSCELLQAIVRFDSCQNAIWAKSQLQGRYIYDRCCQLDIQFYKFSDDENQTGKTLMECIDLDFIKNELCRIMVILERMQDRIKTMNSSIQKNSHAASKSSESTSSISVISPTKPKVCTDSVAVVSRISEIHIKKGTVNNFENKQKFGINFGSPGQVLEQLGSKTYHDLLLSYDDNIHNCKSKRMLKLFDLESAHILFEGMRGLSVIPQHSNIVGVQVCGVLLSEHHPFNFYKEKIEGVLHCTSMDGSSKYACKMPDNMCKHGVIVGYMKKDKSNSVLKIHWKVIGVFDPGGVNMALYDQDIYYWIASVNETVSMFYFNGLLDCMLIFGEKNMFIFDPGGLPSQTDAVVRNEVFETIELDPIIDSTVGVPSMNGISTEISCEIVDIVRNLGSVSMLIFDTGDGLTMGQLAPMETKQCVLYLNDKMLLLGIDLQLPRSIIGQNFNIMPGCLPITNAMAFSPSSLSGFDSFGAQSNISKVNSLSSLINSLVHVRCTKIKSGEIYIFDPGGIFNLDCIFDLEDKVVFERMVMIECVKCTWTICKEIHSIAFSIRLKKLIILPERFLVRKQCKLDSHMQVGYRLGVIFFSFRISFF